MRRLTNIDDVKRKIKRLKEKLTVYNLENNPEENYSFWGAHSIGYIQGQIYLLEELLEDLEDGEDANNNVDI